MQVGLVTGKGDEKEAEDRDRRMVSSALAQVALKSSMPLQLRAAGAGVLHVQHACALVRSNVHSLRRTRHQVWLTSR